MIRESMLVHSSRWVKKGKKIVVSVQHKLQGIQRFDKGEIFRIVAADYDYGPENCRRNRVNLERFVSNACGAMLRLWISQNSLFFFFILYSVLATAQVSTKISSKSASIRQH